MASTAFYCYHDALIAYDNIIQLDHPSFHIIIMTHVNVFAAFDTYIVGNFQLYEAGIYF